MKKNKKYAAKHAVKKETPLTHPVVQPAQPPEAQKENNGMAKKGTAAADRFLKAIHTVISNYQKQMKELVLSKNLSDDDFKMVVSEHTKKYWTGTVSISIETINKKNFKTAKIIIYHVYNVRDNVRGVLICNGLTDDIMFCNIGENSIDVFPSYLESILMKHVSYIMPVIEEKEEETENGK